MKKRSLSLFLAFLMVFGSVLPVFATEPDAGDENAGGEQAPALTYEDLYVEDAVFAWSATGKTAEDTITFGEEETSIVLAEKDGMQLVLKKPTDGTAVYGDGYLEVTEKNADAQLYLSGVYANVPAEAGEAYTYTTSVTMALLPYQGAISRPGFRQDYLPFADIYQRVLMASYSMREGVMFIDADGIAMHNAWSQAYLAAKNDATLQEAFRTPIAEAHYNLLKEDATYASHVFVVDGTDEDATNDPCADYSISGYEADWTAFAYIMSDSTRARSYVIDKNSSNKATMFQSGVGKTVVNTGTWAGDLEWKGAKALWTANDVEEVATQTRINTATKQESDYKYDSKIYVDLDSIAAYSKTSTNAPDQAGIGDDLEFAAGLDARFYSIRVYDRALDIVEIAQNHFAELCEYYQVDLEKIGALNEDALMTAINGCSTLVIGETDKAAIEAVLDEAKASMGGTEDEEDPYASLYVTDGLVYRWDAYAGVPVFAGEATLLDKNGGEASLKLTNAVYNAEKKYLEAGATPFDFSSLIARDEDGAYVEDEIEFELVMTQTAGTENKDTRPYVLLGPANNAGSGKVQTGNGGNAESYGGYSQFYFAYRNPTASETETVTYHFDAEGNKVDAAVEGGTSVDVTYLVKAGGNVQICTETWATVRFVGNYVGESYSIGANMEFALNAGAGTMALQLIRDRQVIVNNGGKAQTFTMSYVPGYGASTGTITKIVPANLAEAQAMAANDPYANCTYPTLDNGVFKIGGSRSSDLSVAYHAFRLYNRTLTVAERAQNHFADLCAYHQIDLAEFNKLSPEQKTNLYMQYDKAVINSREEASNTSFEDVTKAELEAAIQELADETLKPYKALYVAGATTSWNAFHKNNGAAASDAVLTISGGEAAYTDGYLRAIDANVSIANAYALPANGAEINYTTELIYAAYNDGKALAEYTGGGKFTVNYGVPFGYKMTGTFKTLGVSEDITYTDAAGRAMQEAWGSAYLAAENDAALQVAFWTPISEADYNSMMAIPEQAANVRTVVVGGEGVAAYSLTGYEANWAGFQYVISSSGLNRGNYYHGYKYAESNKPGIGNANIMKSDINVAGSWAANLDFDNWGEKGNWSRVDFGVATNHAWIETVTAAADGSSYSANATLYTDNHKLGATGAKSGAAAKFSTAFVINGFDADIYAIRIYPFALTEAQMAQNHFADLANYTMIKNVDVFTALKDASKEALYTEFASVRLTDVDKAELKASLETAIAEAAALEKLEGVTAESILAFDGYQATIWVNPVFRAVFSQKNFNVAGVTVKEAAIGTKIGDGEIAYTAVDLTADDAVIEIVPEMTKEALTAEYAFSAYVTVECDGIEFTFDCDMTSAAFGDTISVSELYGHAALKDGACAKLVAAAVAE